MIYFDNSATTPILPEVADAMRPYLYEQFGNPSGKYYTLADNAKQAVESARESVARLVGCTPEEVVFTSGSTESNNMVIKGVIDQYDPRGTIVTSPTEHPSVLEPIKFLASKGLQVTYLEVDSFGRINPADLAQLLESRDDKPILVTVMWGNNELGSLNDIRGIAQVCHDHELLFHTDATQVIGKIDTRPLPSGIRFVSLSSHKIHGPKGIGACIVRKHPLGFKTKLTPLLHGGGQENDYRSGTLSVHNIVGFGKAAEIAYDSLETSKAHLEQLEKHLVYGIQQKLGQSIRINSDAIDKIPGIINLEFKGINNELLIKNFATDVAISTGSACSSSQPSHVLQSIGLRLNQVRSSVRISLSRLNTIEEVDGFLSRL